MVFFVVKLANSEHTNNIQIIFFFFLFPERTYNQKEKIHTSFIIYIVNIINII